MLKLSIYPTNQIIILKNILSIGTEETDDLYLANITEGNFRAVMTHDAQTDAYRLNVSSNLLLTYVNDVEVNGELTVAPGDTIKIGSAYKIALQAYTEAIDENSINDNILPYFPIDEEAVAETIESVMIAQNSMARFGCDYCFQTINTINERERIIDAKVDAHGRYYHEECTIHLPDVLELQTIQLTIPPSLTETTLTAMTINSAFSNTMNDVPLGISESRVILHELNPQKILVKNNTNDTILLTNTTGTPWLHMEMDIRKYIDGNFHLPANENMSIVFRPFGIRPTHQKHEVQFNSGNRILVYSNGSSVLVWLVAVIFIVLFFNAIATFGNVFNIFRNFSSLFDTQPLATIGNLLWVYIKLSLYVGFIFLVSPTTILMASRVIVDQIKKIPFLRNPAEKILYGLNMWLLMPGRLSFVPANISNLMLFALFLGGLISIPLALVISLILFFVSLTSTEGLFYFGFFIFYAYLFYEFAKKYHLIQGTDPSKVKDSFLKLVEDIVSNTTKNK